MSKATTTTTTDSPLSVFVPITKVDTERREVWGVLAEEALDKSGEILDYDRSKPHFAAWSDSFAKATDGKSVGNLRAMHRDIAAGKFISVNLNDADKRVEVGAKVVDDNEWAKCLEGVYTGFSIGGKYVEKWTDGDAVRYEATPHEGSLVDNPCMYGATFQVVKSEGDPELRKFVGGEAPEETDALKSIVSEFSLLDGDAESWSVDDMRDAVRRAVTTATEEPEAETEETEEPEAAADVPPDEPADDTEPEPEPADDTTKNTGTETLHKLLAAQAEHGEALKAIASGMEETVSKTVTKLVDEATAELNKSVADLQERVEKLASEPREAGRQARAAQKTLGGPSGGSAGNSEQAIEDAIAAFKAAGASETQLRDVRLGLVQKLMGG